MEHPTEIIGNEKRVLARMLGGACSSEDAGDCIGPYRLIERLGEGGFGVVWRAEQTEPVQRQVALKIIKRGMDTGQVLARFDHERQALASMEHPGIAAMLDAGASVDGRPYFAMELVCGESLTKWCADRGSSLRERLGLFEQVCHAVSHAHQKGVIHRDLKPSNILVTTLDGVPMPKVIDFGIAKATQSTSADLSLLTQADQVVGTPLYMSPEQIAGREIDTRSDIYALGVLLYELLTGTLPFDPNVITTEGIEGIKRRIREELPSRPSTFIRERRRTMSKPSAVPPAPALSGFSTDLDWVVMCALEKDPARRYQSAAEFAADIKRFLQDEPILARPPSFTYLAGRWMVRHRTAAIAACAVLATLVVATFISLREAALARTAQSHAEAETRRATQHDRRATQTGSFVSGLLDRVIEEIGKGRNPEALKLALADCGKRIAEIDDDPALRIEMLGKAAEIYTRIGEPRAALPLLKDRADESRRLHGEASAEAVEAELGYLKIFMDHGDRSKASPLVLDLRTRLEAAGQRGTKAWFDVQRALVRSWLKLKKGKEAVVESEVALAAAAQQKLSTNSLFVLELSHVEALELSGEFDRAEQLLEKMHRDAAAQNNAGHMEETASALLHVLWSKKDFTRASALMREQLPAVVAKFGPQSPEMLTKLCELSDSEKDAGQKEQAITHAQSALEIARTRPDVREGFFRALMALAAAETAAGRTNEASAHTQEALKHARDAGNNSRMESALDHLGHLHRTAGRYEEALAWFQQRAELVIATHASTKDIVEALKNICSTCTKLRRRPEAMQAAQQMWDHMKADPALIQNKEFASAISQHAVHSYRMLRNSVGGAPEPADMDAWLQLVDPNDSDVQSILRARQENGIKAAK